MVYNASKVEFAITLPGNYVFHTITLKKITNNTIIPKPPHFASTTISFIKYY